MESEYTLKVGDTITCSDTYEASSLQAALSREGIESEQISKDGKMILIITAVYGKNNNNCKQRGI